MTGIGTDPAQLGLSEAAERVRTGALAPQDLLEACLTRVDAIEPQLRAWAKLHRDEAQAQAAAFRDNDRVGGDGHLLGVPIGVKDNIDTAGVPTTAGSPLLADNLAREDATAVERLRRAGAILLGKTACTELATNDPASTRNPWNPAHTPGGSSAGSGVAVATGMCYATIDTQTAGDTLRPAAYSGVVGFKPTYGRISRRGVLPVAWSIDTVGIQARTVRDVAAVFSVAAGYDPRDPTSVDRAVPDLSSGISSLPRPPRIGVIRGYFYDEAEEEVRHHTDEVAAQLAGAGAQVRQARAGVDFSLLHSAHRVVTFVECAAVHEDLYQRHASRMGEKLRTLLELGLATPAVAYVQAQRVRERIRKSLHELFDNFDVVLTPPAPSRPPDDLTSTGSSVLQIPWTFCGLPSISIPTGLSSDALPMGVQLVGPLFGEQQLLAVADWCHHSLDPQLPIPYPPRNKR